MGFLLNLFEIAILTTTLKVSIAKLAVVDRWDSVYNAFIAIVSITPPSATLEGLEYSIDLTRFGFGLVLMLCVIGGLAGGIVRRSLDDR